MAPITYTAPALDATANQLVANLWSAIGSIARAADGIQSCRLEHTATLETARQQLAYALSQAARVSSLIDQRITDLYETGE